MPRLLGALAALCLLTACPPIDPVWVTTDALPAPAPADPSDSESSTGALPTTSGDTSAAPTSTDATSTSSSTGESTGIGSTSSGDLPQPDACAPTDDFCDNFAAACPTYAFCYPVTVQAPAHVWGHDVTLCFLKTLVATWRRIAYRTCSEH